MRPIRDSPSRSPLRAVRRFAFSCERFRRSVFWSIDNRRSPTDPPRCDGSKSRVGRLLWTRRNWQIARRPGADPGHVPGPRRGNARDFGRFSRNLQRRRSIEVWQMQLAKNVIDVGLSTNNPEPMLRFWQQDVGLRFDHVLPVRRGQKQYRHDALGSVIKLNHHVEAAAGRSAERLSRADHCERGRRRHHAPWSIPMAIACASCRRDMMASPNSPSRWASGVSVNTAGSMATSSASPNSAERRTSLFLQVQPLLMAPLMCNRSSCPRLSATSRAMQSMLLNLRSRPGRAQTSPNQYASERQRRSVLNVFVLLCRFAKYCSPITRRLMSNPLPRPTAGHPYTKGSSQISSERYAAGHIEGPYRARPNSVRWTR